MGLAFGMGLGLSGMLNPHKVMGFLWPYAIAGGWDPSLALVMGGGVVLNAIAIPLIAKRNKTLLQGKPLDLPTSTHIDTKLVAGAALFGIGWGIVGVCPGPGMMAVASGASQLLVWAASFLVGQGVYRSVFA